MPEPQLSRRQFIALAGVAGIGLGIAACVPPLTPIPPLTPTPYDLFPPPFTPIPSITPPVDMIQKISEEEMETFASRTLSGIFETAYNTNPQVQVARRTNSSNISWDTSAIQRAKDSFNAQFDTYFKVPSGPLAQAIKTRVGQLEKDYKKGIRFYKYWGSPNIETVKYMFYLRAIEEIYQLKGYAVEYDPAENREPHKITIYKKGYFEKQEGETNVLGIPLGNVIRYTVNSDPNSGGVLFDSYPLVGQTHPAGHAYASDERKYFIHSNNVAILTSKLKKVARTGRSDAPLENPPDNNGEADAIRETSQKILAELMSEGEDIAAVNQAVIDLHERGHLLEIIPPPVSNETRSYTILLGSADGGPRLSLATLLFVISQKQYLDKVRTNSYYRQDNTSAMYPGVPETLDLIIQDITNLPEDSEIRTKLELDTFSGDKMRKVANTIIPNSSYSAEYTVYVLSRLDRLDDGDINAIAERIFDFRKRDWFPPNSKPIVGYVTREDFLTLVVQHPFALLLVMLETS